MSEYLSVIKNELGETVCYIDDLNDGELEKILAEHEEWYRSTVEA